MANKDLSIAPHQMPLIDSDFGGIEGWWYEESDGIELHIRTPGYPHIRAKILWRSLRPALKRKDR